MNSLQKFDDEQLSDVIIRAIKFNLENDFIKLLKNEAIRRLTHSQHDHLSSLQEALDIIYFKRELELLLYEQSKCPDEAIRDQICNDISLLQSVIDLATQHIK
ncbi:sporulation histidine kinase inhibitor Sda [Robertmurraya korlensis]|uniref:sporulation histidine kinase inhibitor Sda n=1 Tax=Robertmurraya korlensis TaxID=519977 RepID=UPI0008271B3F|nr:sporulation histidine kinase inhibitor Sda [Robertmurraya korlensis]